MLWYQVIQNRWIQLGTVAVLCLGIGTLYGRSIRTKPDTITVEKQIKVVDKVATEKAIAEARQSWLENYKDITTEVEVKNTDGTITKTKIVDKGKIKERVITKIEIREVVKRETVTVEKEKIVQVTQPKIPLSRFSVGVSALKPANQVFTTKPTEQLKLQIEAGTRLGNMPLWITGGYVIQDKAVGIGLRYEF